MDEVEVGGSAAYERLLKKIMQTADLQVAPQ